MEQFKSIKELRELLLEAAEEADKVAQDQHLSVNPRLIEIFSKISGERPAENWQTNALTMDIRPAEHKAYMDFPTWRNLSKEDATEKLAGLMQSKYRMISWQAFMYAANHFVNYNDESRYVGMSENFIRFYAGSAHENGDVKKQLTALANIEVTKGHFLKALERYSEYEYYYKGQILRRNTENNGMKKFVENMRGEVAIDQKEIKNQFFKISSELKDNWLVARTWGFEVEVPDAKGVDVHHESGIEKGDDGSLRSYESNDDCECDCSDCCYHDCDCDYCESQNTDPEHCGNSYCAQCDSAEFRTTGGIQRAIHSGLKKLSEDLIEAEAENNDTAGVHIHVYGADLTMQQVAQVVAIYAITSNVLSVIAGRQNVTYAADISMSQLSKVLDKKNPKLYNDKPIAVNLGHLKGRGTIEFRQMACNFDWREITTWAFIVRGIVNAAKRGATFRDFKHVTDLNNLLDRIAKFNHVLGNETPEEHVYGSRVDKNIIERGVFIYE